MALAARLTSPAALFRKLEREAYRAFHAASPLEKADHFYNFCVTASSMRDYCHEHLGLITKQQRKLQEHAWRQLPRLVTTFEIANSTKHFVLREPHSGTPRSIQTRTVRGKNAKFIDIYMSASGEVKVIPVVRQEITITLSDGTRLDLHDFTRDVLAYWRSYLSSLGIKVRRQSFDSLSGRVPAG